MYCTEQSLDKVKVMVAELYRVQVKDIQMTRRVLDGTKTAILYTALLRGTCYLPGLHSLWVFYRTCETWYIECS